MPDNDRSEPLLIILAAFLAYTSLFFGIVALDPDPGRDFVAADLLYRGKILYRDVQWFFGPLAPWFHGLLFRLFGPSAIVLLVTGALVSLAIVLVAYFLARQILSTVAATVAALLVVAQASYGFNMFTYATPYTFAATYGLLFSLLTLYAGLRALDAPGRRWDAAGGAAAALALASKQEFALIAALVLATGLAFRRLRGAVVALAAYVAVAGAFAVILFRQVTVAEFFACVFPKQAPAWRTFYENVQYWGPNLWIGIHESVTGLLGNLAFVLWASCLLARPARRLLLLLAVAAPLVLWQARYLWYYPLLLHLAALAFAWKRRKVVFLTLSAAFFLIRVLPHPATKGYYGLLYFIPSLVVYLYLCFEVAAPRLVRFCPRIRPAMAAVLLVCFGVTHFFVLNARWGRRTAPVSTERGLIRVEQEEAAKTQVILQEIRRHTAPHDRILMLPHGCMYNFVTGRQPPSRYLAYTYGQVLDGEDERQEIERLEQAPPKLVVIDDFPHMFHVEHSVNTFGAAYSRELYGWIRQHYQEVRTIPYQGHLVHLLVLKNAGFSELPGRR